MGEIIISILIGMCVTGSGIFIKVWLGREYKKESSEQQE
jgi:hypothetical protein